MTLVERIQNYPAKLAALPFSRRFQLALAAAIVVALQDYLGISEELAWQLVAIVSAWVLGDSVSKTGGEK